MIGRKLNFNEGTLGKQVIKTSSNKGTLFDANDKIPGIFSAKKQFKVQKNTRIRFGMSSEVMDAGQSFVPYFDGNDVSFDVKTPLSGLSFVHFTNDDNYAGYIKPVIVGLDYRKYFNTSYQPEEFVPINYKKLNNLTLTNTVN